MYTVVCFIITLHIVIIKYPSKNNIGKKDLF